MLLFCSCCGEDFVGPVCLVWSCFAADCLDQDAQKKKVSKTEKKATKDQEEKDQKKKKKKPDSADDAFDFNPFQDDKDDTEDEQEEGGAPSGGPKKRPASDSAKPKGSRKTCLLYTSPSQRDA